MKKLFIIFLFLLLAASSLFSQQSVASGIVMDEQNEPIIGASVVVVGNTKVGTITDYDGKYSLEVPSGSKKLLISYIGMKSQEVVVKTNARVILASNTEQLQEVVVTGMQKMDKRLFTGATTKIDAGKAKLDGVADISRALEGKAAGVSIQNVSGTFGTAPKIRVRGATSIYGNSKPLWVVDGVVLEDAVEISSDALSSGDAVTLISSAISGLNADDIESFQILKDGSATSIYGARAMAGVVVVTTKKGAAGSSKMNYTGELSYRLKPNYRDFNICNSQEQMGIYKEMEDKGWLEFASIANGSSSGIYGNMYSHINVYDPITGEFDLVNAQGPMNAFLQEAEFRNTDWFDLLFENTITQNHAISISNGTEKAQFYASMSYMNDPGWTKASSVDRYTVNANASYNISKTVKISMLTSDSYRKQKAPGTLSQEVDVVSGEVRRGFDINPYSFALNTSRTMNAKENSVRNYATFNIFDELDNNYIDLNIYDLKFQADVSWKAFRELELQALGAVRYQSTQQEHFVKDHSNQANAFRAGISPENSTIRYSNPFLYTDPDDPNGLPQTVMPEGGIYYLNNYSVSQKDFRATANYNDAFNDDTHIVNFFGGMELNATDRNAINFQGWGFQYDNGGIPSADPSLFKQQKEENTPYYGNGWTYSRSLAYFASGTYSYKSRYIINGTGRYEGTNKLGKSRKSRWLPTYNISGAWNAHNEVWFPQIFTSVLTHFSLKASYSLTADRGPAWVTNAQPVYKPYTPWRPLNNVYETGIYLEDIANNDLTYEKKHEYNMGVSAGFFENRINFDLDVYKRNNFDLIGRAYTQGAGGVIAKYANVASMRSHGVEATLSTRNIITPNFKWTTDFTFSKTKNKITKLENRSSVIDLVTAGGYAKEGYPVRAIFSIPFVGLNDEGLPVIINEDGEQTSSDINFQEFEKLDFLKYEGPTDPTITGGFGNMVNYKSFHLNVFLTYSFGNKVRLDPIFRSSYSDMTAHPKEFKNRWTVPGDEERTNIPAIASRAQLVQNQYLSYGYNAYNYSTARIADGGFIRMKEISLSYDLPSAFLQKIGVSNAQVKIQATNLFLLYSDSKLNGQDPEFFNSGGVATPMPKQFTFTLRFGI
ncbi:MAG: SusC/RagA family TonB-linked outer membrane protein [Bacteroidales bacterium]